MDVSSKIYQAIDFAVNNKRVKLSVHAILRYIERSYAKDIDTIRISIKNKQLFHVTSLTRNNAKISDTELFTHLIKNFPDMVDRARSDLNYYIQNKTYNFKCDDLQFIIRDATLITVYEV